MKNFKRLIMVGAIVSMLGAVSVTAYAASSYSTPAEAVAGLTGKTAEEVTAERIDTGKTYGTIANEAGKLEEFQSEMLQIKKDTLQERVENGTMTQERADAIISAMEKNQATCDGTGNLHIGQGRGNRQGMGGYGQCGGLCQQ